ncbi:peptide ABC transporter substrate-binding protein [Brachyspira pilosicoli]|uniref:Extracellular solute binding protein, family 5 n=1 Tax=Brachyspira pilosicoli (strain ATCC BAA-1826 / 95/1000) TaxID=759914 RepID=D8IAM7_BRAP9|nr:peptide ABC transporter substrate-binding protein [Brachyspira pilosicoli]ADK30208.1 extracellular solute binding protein, family 5 [Brachyspira pilosicoli 95/1000]
MERNRFLNILLILASILLLSCHKEPKKILNEITVSVGGKPNTMDPSKTSSISSMIYINHLFENLTIKDENGNIIPGSAEKWISSNNNTIYIFYIRTNAKWADGFDLKADDFVYAWRRIVDPKTQSPLAVYLENIKNAHEIINGNMDKEQLGVKALDNDTLYVELEYPVPYFDELVCHSAYTPLREDIVSKNENNWSLNADTMIGNGAFQIVRLDDYRLVIRKNTDYWNYKNIKADIINFEFINNHNEALSLIEKDELYFYNNIPIEKKDELFERNIAKNTAKTSLYFYEINNRVNPLSNAMVRKAISLAIDRNFIITNIVKSDDIAASAIVPYNIKYDNKDFRAEDTNNYFHSEDYNKNIELAKNLLEEAGYKNADDFPVIELLTDDGLHLEIANAIKKMLKENLNIDTIVISKPYNEFIRTRRRGNFDIARRSWAGGYNHPMSFLSLLQKDYILNEGKYYNPLYDENIRNYLTTQDIQYLHSAEKIAIEDTAIIPIFYYNSIVMQNPKLINVTCDNFGVYNFKNAEIIEEADN